jgi:hypothetical protein
MPLLKTFRGLWSANRRAWYGQRNEKRRRGAGEYRLHVLGDKRLVLFIDATSEYSLSCLQPAEQ